MATPWKQNCRIARQVAEWNPQGKRRHGTPTDGTYGELMKGPLNFKTFVDIPS
jgi:hypothetical protein